MHTLVYIPPTHVTCRSDRKGTDRDCWVIQANMIDFMITLKVPTGLYAFKKMPKVSSTNVSRNQA